MILKHLHISRAIRNEIHKEKYFPDSLSSPQGKILDSKINGLAVNKSKTEARNLKRNPV